MWMEGLGRKVLFGILQPRKALKSLMKPRKFSGTDQKCTTSSSIHIIYMYVPNRLQIVLLLSCYCAAILHVHQLCILRMFVYYTITYSQQRAVIGFGWNLEMDKLPMKYVIPYFTNGK